MKRYRILSPLFFVFLLWGISSLSAAGSDGISFEVKGFDADDVVMVGVQE